MFLPPGHLSSPIFYCFYFEKGLEILLLLILGTRSLSAPLCEQVVCVNTHVRADVCTCACLQRTEEESGISFYQKALLY